MKRIYIQFLLLLTVVFSISLQAQTLPTVNNDEFLMNSKGTYSDLQPDLSGNCSGCEVPDLNFNWSSSFNTAVLNETYIRRAADKKLREWYERQKVVIENFLENKYHKQFSSFNEAKDYAFIDFELKNITINVAPIVSAKNSDKRQRALKKAVHIKGLKALKIREAEIKAGNTNKPLYPDFEVNGTPLKNLKSTAAVTAAYNNLLNQFVDNTWKGFESGYIAKILGIPFNNKVLKTKNNYFGSLGTWDKLDFMQFIIHYEQITKTTPVLPTEEELRLFKKYINTANTVTATYVENYINANKESEMSLFHPNYWKIIWKRDYSGNHFRINEAKNKHQQLKGRELSRLIGSTSMNATSTIDYLVSLLKITDKDQLQWLNDHPSKGDEFVKEIKEAKQKDADMPPPIPGELSFPPDHHQQLAQWNIRKELKNGAVIGGLVRELKLTDANQKKWLYEHKTAANNFIGFANNNRISDKITDKAQAYIKGQVELEAETQNIPWKPSTGIIENNPNLKFTHVYHDFGKRISYYRLTDGSIIASSSYEKSLTSAGDLIDKDRSNIGGCQNCRFYYIKLSENDAWAEMLFNPNNLGEDLKTLFALAGKDIGVNLGRYVLPIEDIKILIDGKDFDGEDVARWQAAGGILLTVVPGGKVVGASARVFKVVDKIADGSKAWGAIAKAGEKTISFGLKKSGEAADLLKNARKLAGKAKGFGVDIKGKWLRGSNGNAGFFPKSIASKMRGKNYKNFDDFRTSFWKNVASDPNLAKEFSSSNISRMKSGLAPKVHSSQQLGKQTSYILHHKTPINQGGAVYNVDNLFIVTPRYHKEILLPKYHYGYGY